MSASYDEIRNALLDAALAHVPFDGWSEATFRAAAEDAGIAAAQAKAICPRGAVDLALAYHQRGDDEMVRRLKQADMSGMRFRDKVALAVRLRIEAISDKEAVRRGMTLFALPHHAADGAKAIWGTADRIWTALGDSSDDVNWYTKRLTLGGVYSSTVLFWLGDNSVDTQATWDFLDRRIDEVMQIEKLKAKVRESRTLSALFAGPNWVLRQVKAPPRISEMKLPGSWTAPPPRQ